MHITPPSATHSQGSELAGWALGRYSYEGIDMNHNFADLNSVMWDAQELETDKSKLINHYFPLPENYTSEHAFVSAVGVRRNRGQSIVDLHSFALQAANVNSEKGLFLHIFFFRWGA